MLPRNGFSLIEILVVMGIIGIMAAAGVASYNQMNMESQVEMEAKRIVSQLRSWQKEADSGVGSTTCSPNVYGGIRVYFEQLSGTDSVRAVLLCGAAPETPLKTVEMRYSSLVVTNKNLTFLPLGQGVSNPGSADLTMNGITYRITVTAAGGVSAAKL